MSRLRWGSFGSQLFEAGVDRGVFYPTVGPGMPWNGLINVKEDPAFEPKTTFVDGVPYRNQKTKTNFAAVLQAYYCPREFEEYDGSFGQQRRKAFGLSYRTRVGNDISADYGYKIHIVYNALAMPTQTDTSSIDESGPNATPFSWGLSATPIPIPGVMPAAHLIIDTTIAYPEAIQAIEDVLYGSATMDARLPGPEELIELFEQHAIFVVFDHGDGSATVMGPDSAVSLSSPTSAIFSWPSVVQLDVETYRLSSL